ncbi:MAG: ABC transporter permease [Lachnospiraceae bacterium]|nr:ABC transporter permease [Lachnospiraceae bacterium]MBR1669497.1 ABC transporter permease [Butyrivibrio sp.]
MGQIGEYFKSAVKQIVGNGYRTLMTMLGIVIGIAAVIAVVSLGTGMSDYVTSELNGLAGNYGIVMVDSSKTSERFTRDDMALVSETVKDIHGITPNISSYGKVKGSRKTVECSLEAGTEVLEAFSTNGIAKGSYFTAQQVESGARVCVMLLDDAKEIFGTEDAIGRDVEISMYGKSVTYTVVGLRGHMSEMYEFMMQGQDYYAQLEVPYTCFGEDFDYDTVNFTNLVVFADQSILSHKVDEVKNLLANVHGLRGSNALSGYSLADFSEQLDQILGYARSFLLLVSVISLIVGGIGVMNIMLVSVSERTREIGIRKSIGAKTGAIMIQFLFEAAVLTFLGGVVGIILGVIASYIICTAIGFRVIIEPATVLGAAMFSVLIGLFFGLYPARKAAKMRPIDALRL